MKQQKIKILILGSDDFLTACSIRNLLNNDKLEIRGMIISPPTLGKSSIFTTIIRLFQRSGSHYLLFQVLQKGILPIFLRLVKESNFLLPSKLLKQRGTCIYQLKNSNREGLFKLVSQLAPDLMISSQFTRIIEPEILKIPRYGCINIHKSNLPSYRGIAPLFWALKNNEEEVGVAVHLMDEGVDTGLILLQQRFPIEKGDTVLSLTIKCAKITPSLVKKAVEGLIAGKVKAVSQVGKASYYSWPLKRDVREFLANEKSFWHLKDLKKIQWLTD